mmetsp:Transcript_26010/g.37310  ORF Transcript_26010/g.37310 Transcript_26010/m.37310 type:complete len:91 (+) Transcript_26010:3834-4106(+)
MINVTITIPYSITTTYLLILLVLQYIFSLASMDINILLWISDSTATGADKDSFVEDVLKILDYHLSAFFILAAGNSLGEIGKETENRCLE